MHGRLLVVVALVLAACGNKDGDAAKAPGACKPLTITVDGKALPALPHAYGRKDVMGSDTTYEINIYNHDKYTCAEQIAGSHTVPAGEIGARAFAGGKGAFAKGVGIDVHTQMGGAVELIGDPPKAVGDKLSICVDHVSFEAIAGAYKDKTVVIDGRFDAPYCGEMKMGH